MGEDERVGHYLKGPNYLFPVLANVHVYLGISVVELTLWLLIGDRGRDSICNVPLEAGNTFSVVTAGNAESFLFPHCNDASVARYHTARVCPGVVYHCYIHKIMSDTLPESKEDIGLLNPLVFALRKHNFSE